MIESSKRTLVKTVSWRIVATIATFAVSYFISGDYEVATGIAGIQIFVHTGLYYFHERMWINVNWGKTKKGA